MIKLAILINLPLLDEAVPPAMGQDSQAHTKARDGALKVLRTE